MDPFAPMDVCFEHPFGFEGRFIIDEVIAPGPVLLGQLVGARDVLESCFSIGLCNSNN